MRHLTYHLLPAVACLLSSPAFAQSTEYLPGIEWDTPPVVEPGATDNDPPSDAIVLFGGEDMSAWENGENWPIKDGVVSAADGAVTTKQHFGDLQLHLEWSAPTKIRGKGQGRGNSGVFLMGVYEVQVLDSYDNSTYPDGQAGAVYKQTPPMANAMRKPGEWNTYDIFWTAPKLEAGQVVDPAVVTVVHNGVLVVNHFELAGATAWHTPPSYSDASPKGPISLQDHGNPVRFRNIWVRELKAPHGEQVREPMLHDHSTGERRPFAEAAGEASEAGEETEANG
ncbi:hypothetical protein Mal64_17970 [Pseudobythopirellula maris]|uniref:3-keto-alpha-glucoside-1,2-lyase/3-keto-2-hydroxy-glucal hydratase domain-containing protein n=1 Tax=Pseudobythopirellula maris TaxID=2527991 RepID=A0A5C5ZM77_9BACT|nr:DUF1080 domain-containing protein [Pseudobythopirellula maris]TWT88318.1 hypothetical protein Mal64_17970 [Pseudobythopirellula maris]